MNIMVAAQITFSFFRNDSLRDVLADAQLPQILIHMAKVWVNLNSAPLSHLSLPIWTSSRVTFAKCLQFSNAMKSHWRFLKSCHSYSRKYFLEQIKKEKEQANRPGLCERCAVNNAASVNVTSLIKVIMRHDSTPGISKKPELRARCADILACRWTWKMEDGRDRRGRAAMT